MVNGSLQLGVSSKDERAKPHDVNGTWRQRSPISVGDVAQPLRRVHRLRLEQHPAEVPVDHAHVQWLEWRRHPVEFVLQRLDIALIERLRRC
jgi:hypothetical protein